MKHYLDKKLVVGIKLFTGHEAFYLTDERLKEVYELAIQYNVPVLFHSGWDNSQYSDAMLVASWQGNIRNWNRFVVTAFILKLIQKLERRWQMLYIQIKIKLTRNNL